MAKEIALGKKNPLLDRVTGKKPASGSMPVPPPARQIPGTSGTPPLPVGKVVQTQGKRLTAEELRVMQSVGWKEGDPIPQNMAAILDAAAAEMIADANEFVTPVPLDTPPVRDTTVPIESLPASERARISKIQQDMRQALAQENQERQLQQEQREMSQLPPSVREAAMLASKTSKQTQNAPTIEVDDDISKARQPAAQARRPEARPQARQAPTTGVATNPSAADFVAGQYQTREQAEAYAQEVKNWEGEPAATGAAPSVQICRHCGWNQAQEDIPEPDYHDKMAFLQSVLGQKPFVKEYDLYGGAVQVTFRTLSTQEADACWKQVNHDVLKRNLTSELDMHEKVQRYRTCMQTLRLTSREFDHEQPDGLTSVYNPNATAFWTFDPESIPEGETPLPLVEEYMFKHVFRTETVGRTVTVILQQFNRLVAKMEAMVDNADFWKATGAPR